MATVAEQLITYLYDRGVRYVFGIPGGPSIPYIEAMREQGIEFILTANEQSAAIMADMVGRLTGVPGVCHGTFGPGAVNLATGVGGAFLDRSPLIALTTEVKDSQVGRRVQMNIDHQALFKPLTKWTTRLSAENVHQTMAHAFQIAAAETPGPVHIGLPAGIEGFSAEPVMTTVFEKDSIPALDLGPLQQGAEIIKNAKKPLVAIGLSAVRLGLHHAIRDFIDKHNIPVVLTPMAKGMVPEDHPCYTGVLFHAKSDCIAPIYRQADAVIAIGYDTVEFNYESWMPVVPLVHLDSEAVDITAEYDNVLSIQGDLAQSVAFLHSLSLPQYDWDWEEIISCKTRMFQELMRDNGSFTPARLLTVLQRVMPEQGIVTSDVGAHLHLLGQLWKTAEPNGLIMTNGWSAMGFGIPAALGAKLCRPASTVVCITGDGGFLMNCGELLTARRLGLSVVVVVLCDQSLSLIEIKQGWNKVSTYGTDLYEGDFFGADTFLGVPILTAANEDQAKSAFETAFTMTGPVIIAAQVDGSSYKDLITRSYK